jgi:hypothetical protein
MTIVFLTTTMILPVALALAFTVATGILGSTEFMSSQAWGAGCRSLFPRPRWPLSTCIKPSLSLGDS